MKDGSPRDRQQRALLLHGARRYTKARGGVNVGVTFDENGLIIRVAVMTDREIDVSTCETASLRGSGRREKARDRYNFVDNSGFHPFTRLSTFASVS